MVSYICPNIQHLVATKKAIAILVIHWWWIFWNLSCKSHYSN